MRASFTKTRASRRVASTLSYSSPPLAIRTFASTSRQCDDTREDGQPLRFSDFQKNKAVENPVEQPDKPINAASQDKPAFTTDASGRIITYAPRGSAPGYQIERQDKLLRIKNLTTEKQMTFLAHSLRDACTCMDCRDKSSGNKKFSLAQVPLDLAIKKVVPRLWGLDIVFSNDFTASHHTYISFTRLEAAMEGKPPMSGSSIKDQLVEKTGVLTWDRKTIQKRVRTLDYAEFAQKDEVMWQVIADLSRYGLVFLKNVPQEEDSIKKITTRIANIQETFYGRTFDVRAKPNAENVAYTSGYLGLHQDLLYLRSPPQIQILHCLENSCAGGESLFADGDRVGRAILAATAGPKGENLRRALELGIPYRYDKNGHYYMQRRPFLQTRRDPVSDEKVFDTMWWSPPFAAPDLEAANVGRESLLLGAKAFEKAIHAEENMYERKMEPGECVLFDNRRIMHGRRAFDVQGGGSRWLRGAYISEEDFFSKASNIKKRDAVRGRDSAMRTRAEANKVVAKTALARAMRKELTKTPSAAAALRSKRRTEGDREAAKKRAQSLPRLRDGVTTAKDDTVVQEKIETVSEEKPETVGEEKRETGDGEKTVGNASAGQV